MVVLDDTVRIIRDTSTFSTSVRVSVTNQDDRPFYTFPCGHTLMRRSASADHAVFSQPCPEGPRIPVAVEPGHGTTVRIVLRVRRDTLGDRWPNGSIDGDYYVIAWLVSSPPTAGFSSLPLPTRRRTSPTFPARLRVVADG
ncbi:MAG: hypothetical protein IT361_09390 [Gemmatimonadaceae bacterium]|nr:hypothetical protein [Gemmatimonadaceae bacterium]